MERLKEQRGVTVRIGEQIVVCVVQEEERQREREGGGGGGTGFRNVFKFANQDAALEGVRMDHRLLLLLMICAVCCAFLPVVC